MKDDKLNNFIQFVINYLLMPIAILFLLVMCIIIFATTSHAASANGPQLPIYVDNIDVSPYQTYINNTYGGFWNLSQNNVIGWGSQENGYYVQTFAIPQVADQVQNYLSFSPNMMSVYPDYDYNNNTITLTFTNLANDNYKPWRLISFYSNGIGPNYPYSAAFNQSNTINKGVYGSTGSQLNYVSSTIYLTNNGAWQVDKAVFVNELIPIIPDIGAAIIPPAPIIPDYVSGDTPPTQVPPSFTPSDYQWTTPPTFDGSSVENALNSVKGTLEWLANNLHLELKNLTDNGKHFVDYIGKTMQYYGNAILETLNNFIQNFYDNMANVVQPIFDKLSYITEPIDSNAISDAFNENGLIQVKNDFIDFFNDFDDLIRNTPEPDTFDITINVQNVRTFYNFGVRSPVVLHLGNNLNGTLKTAFRAFLWVLVIVGSIFLTEKNLSAWIKGGGFSDK